MSSKEAEDSDIDARVEQSFKSAERHLKTRFTPTFDWFDGWGLAGASARDLKVYAAIRNRKLPLLDGVSSQKQCIEAMLAYWHRSDANRSNQKSVFGLVITGSREIKDSKFVVSAVQHELSSYSSTQCYWGDCPTGVDAILSAWRDKHPGEFGGIQLFADWKKYGRAAGPIRNKEMLKKAAKECMFVHVLAFPLKDKQKSTGTRGCIEIAKKMGMNVIVREQ